MSVSSGTTPSGIYYEVHGASGPALFLAFPITASPILRPEQKESVANGFLARLTDGYQVLIADYPSLGKSATIPPAELTIQRVCADLLEVADQAGFSTFVYWGGTFGAIAGLHLAATHPDRVSSLVSAGWPPLQAPYATMLRGARINLANPPPHARAILRDPTQYLQWVTFYESILRSCDEGAIARIVCPRLVVYGADSVSDVAGLELNLAATIRASRPRLEALGWQIVEIPDRDDRLILDADALVPPVRRFLDRVI